MTTSIKPQNCKVTIANNNGSIQLRYTYSGTRQQINIGLPYTPENLSKAYQTAYTIDTDIKNDLYTNKNNYKIKKSVISPHKEITPEKEWNLQEIFSYYCNIKHNPDPSMKIIRKRVATWLQKTPNELLKLDQADLWLNYLRYEIPHSKGRGYSDKTIANSWSILITGINLAIAMKKISYNPLIPLSQTLNTKISKEIKSYSGEEIKIILQKFSESYYRDFIEFRFLTGCRPSEAIALTTTDIIKKDNRTYILFNKRYVRGQLKEGLKNGKHSRLFPCNLDLQELINNITNPPHNPLNLLFPSPQGLYINTDNLSRRIWKPAIDELVANNQLPFYLPFYDCRHCFGSLILRKTSDIKTVSTIMGNSPQTLYKHYLADNLDFEVPPL
ncbi:phage integrase [Geminocystis sp. NIES-3708]|uniref:tyrosine-type recombinase/integrase n=1 Tax=Geminocystis sp. NIES-3708 TaxID=1615909 RepID=UPI0005FC9E9D|nr:tyrosine-type recombinase/integrase [Geminocystis sp. NIES-3708]BAQ61637.1 phage integrase [Geminocystis sp. NIES-3708]